eukprot:852009_1
MTSLPTHLAQTDSAGNSLYSGLRDTLIQTPPLHRFDEINYNLSGQILPLNDGSNIASLNGYKSSLSPHGAHRQNSLNSYRNLYGTPGSSTMSQAASNISIISMSKLTGD